MKGLTLRISLAASLLALLSLVGALPTQSDSGRAQLNRSPEDRAKKGAARPGVRQLSYRSPSANHKLLLSKDDADIGVARPPAPGERRKVWCVLARRSHRGRA